MVAACWASLAVLAGSMATLYAVDWYKDIRRQNRRLAKKSVVENGHIGTKEEHQLLNK